MNRYRTLINLLLGLTLLVQGVVVSASVQPPMGLNSPESADEMADMPCHDAMAADTAEKSPSGKMSCCNENCPDMTSCLLGHYAPSAELIVTSSPTTAAPAAIASARVLSVLRTFPLRPPIYLHG